MSCRDNQVRLGKYVVQEEIGAGGFGTVRKAFDESTGETVAIKILDKTQLGMYEMTQCVKKEIELLTILRHPNIVRGKEVLGSKRKIFLVMEFVDGGDAHTALTKRGRYPEDEARIMFRSLMEALVYCHSKGVYHRDLKLENMLLTSSGDMKVCDFGLASVRDLHNSKTDLCSTVVGTEDFSCPEIVQSIPYRGEKADMWSCGVILYTLLAGYFPFQGSTPGEVAQSVVNTKFTFPRHFSKEVKEVIQGLLVKDPRHRKSAFQVMKSRWLRINSPTSVSNFVVLRNPRLNGSCSSRDSSKLSISPSPSADDGDPYRKSWRKFHKGAIVPVKISVLRITRKFGSTHSIKSTTDRPKSDLDGNFTSFSIFDALGRARIQNFAEILDLMKDKNNGIPVQDRRWRLRTYRTCFTGQEAVQWMCKRFQYSVEDAVSLGQMLHDAGVFHHVCRDHSFKNEHLFYRWLWDDVGYEYVLNGRYFHRALYSREAGRVVFDLLSELLNICRFHQQLHDFRQIDMLGIQQDSRFITFSKSVVELQTVSLGLLDTFEQKLSFLVNLYNMFWIQARIHIGDFDEIDFEKMTAIAGRLEYIISGTSVTLQNVSTWLFSSPNIKDTQNSDAMSIREKDEFPPTMSSRLGSIFQSDYAHDGLVRESIQPFILFVISDSSPMSPAIKAVTENDMTEPKLHKAAGRYMDKLLEVDLEQRTVRYPTRVGEFRRLMCIEDDQEMLEILTELTVGFEIQDDLQNLREKLQTDARSLVLMEIEDDLFPFSKTMFAPEILSELQLSR